jgi:hypothetical protein
MGQKVTVETLLNLTEQLSTIEKVRLIERLAPQIAHDLSPQKKKGRKSLRGLWRGTGITKEEIDKARYELWQNFPRDNI